MSDQDPGAPTHGAPTLDDPRPHGRPPLDLSLYLVADTGLCDERSLVATVAEAAGAGVTAVQLRATEPADEDRARGGHLRQGDGGQLLLAARLPAVHHEHPVHAQLDDGLGAVGLVSRAQHHLAPRGRLAGDLDVLRHRPREGRRVGHRLPPRRQANRRRTGCR